MITRLYADNFKTLVNFELTIGPHESACLGPTARGSRTVLEAIRLIRSFVCEDEASDALFPIKAGAVGKLAKFRHLKLIFVAMKERMPIGSKLSTKPTSRRCHVRSEQLSYNRDAHYMFLGWHRAQLYATMATPGPRGFKRLESFQRRWPSAGDRRQHFGYSFQKTAGKCFGDATSIRTR